MFIIYLKQDSNMEKGTACCSFYISNNCCLHQSVQWSYPRRSNSIRIMQHLLFLVSGCGSANDRYVKKKNSYIHQTRLRFFNMIGFPNSKVHGANMGPTWVLLAPGGPHICPMSLAIRVLILWLMWSTLSITNNNDWGCVADVGQHYDEIFDAIIYWLTYP